MRRSDRHHALIDHLRARAPRTVSAARLADRFGVSTRTIERDLAALTASGVPLYATGGRSGGYSILPTYELPPLNFTVDEAFACAVALDLLAGSPFGEPARRARDRIAAALPPATRAAAGGVPVEQVTSAALAPGLGMLPLAIATRETIRLTYRGEVREADPLRLLHGAGHWYLIVWAHPAGGVRGFRTDRIEAVEPAGRHFEDTHDAEVAADLDRWTREPAGDLR